MLIDKLLTLLATVRKVEEEIPYEGGSGQFAIEQAGYAVRLVEEILDSLYPSWRGEEK